ncbi:sulfur relay protein TusB [Achromatium sp. WMS3]|nr:sulfur relay protein TusB [Achromatium sp. WMS3]
MSMLHVVNKSPYERDSLATCAGYCHGGDTVLLIEDGVYAAIAAGKAAASLQGLTVAALGPDLKARGIGEDKLISGVKIVDYTGFVDLVANTDRVQSWL